MADKLLRLEGDSALAALRCDIAVAAVHEAHVNFAVLDGSNLGCSVLEQDESDVCLSAIHVFGTVAYCQTLAAQP